MRKIIHIVHMGNIGNRMFQYMFGRRLQSLVHMASLTGYNIPGWSIAENSPFERSPDTLTIEGNHLFNLSRAAYLLNSGVFSNAFVKVFAHRLEYLPTADEARKWFYTPPLDVPTLTSKELLINIRGAEILSGLHRDYMPLPVDFYTKIVDETGLSPVFMGQIDDGPYGSAIKQHFGGARVLPSMSPLLDFRTIMRSTHICCSVSSFSWLAAWMSPVAESIHLPVAGLMNPLQRPDIDLLPRDDPRYSFYEFDVMHWTGSAEQIALVTGKPHDLRHLDVPRIATLMRNTTNVVLA